MANSKQIDLPKLNANFTTTFYTVSGSYPVVARSTSGSVPSNSRKYFDDGLISFNTNNDLSNNNPSFSIMLTDAYDWKSLLVLTIMSELMSHTILIYLVMRQAR